MSIDTEPSIAQTYDERLWGMLTHLVALSGFIVPPLGFVLGPLIIWLIKKDQYPFVNDQGKESLNFQISMMIYMAVSVLMFLILIGFITLFILIVMEFILVIVASVAANEGKPYRYPMTIRFIK